jgi:uncharacterized protein (TIGR00290 family)
VILSWSGGKDSALALYELRKTERYDIIALLTTLTEDYDRVSMHGIQRHLLELQAESLDIPLEKVFISKNISNEEYEYKMRDVLKKYASTGVNCVAFGDIFLEDVRRYREEKLSKIAVMPMFPLWRKDTSLLASTFIKLGFKAVITCVDSNFLDKQFAGKNFDEQFLSHLPAAVDPCGENGEFHSFVYDGPTFRQKIPHTTGQVVLRENRFYYCDVLSVQTGSSTLCCATLRAR